jgi:ATP-binding cassette subfamily F protein 3
MLFRLSDIYKSYAGNEILRGVSFQINPNEKVGLVGRNGAGKTTVFRVITGEESADSGEVIKLNNLKIGLLAQHVDFTEDETVHTAALSAFQRLHDIEAEMRHLEVEMATNATDEVLEKYADLQIEFENADGFTYTARAETILLGLGFTKETWHLETKNLSGGQKNRLGMARLLLSNPDILLLDEPTNHLDVNAVEWLENFLQSYETAFVIVSHDRYFLDRTCRRIIEIDRGKAITYKGNYSQFLVEREERREIQRREFENQQSHIAKTEEYIRRNLAGQKTKQAKSRRTLLERMERVEAVTVDKSSGNFNLKKVERAGLNILTAEDLAIGYGEKVLAKDINFTLNRGECLGIIGGNGTGKTTFLKTILGNLRELDGKLNWGTKTNIGYYAQNLEDLDSRNEIVQELRRVAPNADNGEVRSFLAKFLFTGEEIFKKVADLSGGEKGRLALAKLIYSGVNVLVLDEPTNHLDIPSREALEAALDNYPGTILAVSHDRFFLDEISTQIFSFEESGETVVFDGNYSEFHDWKEAVQSSKSKVQSQPKDAPVEETKTSTNNGQQSKLSKNQLQQVEQRVKEIESVIPQMEAELAKLTLEMSLPQTIADHAKLQKVSEKYKQKEKQIQDLYQEWEKLES